MEKNYSELESTKDKKYNLVIILTVVVVLLSMMFFIIINYFSFNIFWDNSSTFKISQLACYENNLSFSLENNLKSLNFTQVKFIINDKNNSEEFVKNISLPSFLYGSIYNFTFEFSTINCADIRKIEVIPILNNVEEIKQKYVWKKNFRRGIFLFSPKINISSNSSSGINSNKYSSSGGGSSGGGTSVYVSSCSDGILNGDETNVDCGGSCSVCRDFYISNSGNDNNDGLSSISSWRTLEKLNSVLLNGTIHAGDIIGFKSEDTFIGTLNTSGVDGSSGSSIIFTSYGSGEKPIFSGLITLNNSWVSIGGNIWEYNVSSLPATHVRYLTLNGTNQNMAQSNAYYANNISSKKYLLDPDLGGSDGDYVDSEILLRTSAYTWEIRNVTGYNSSSGNVTFYPDTYVSLWTVPSVGGYFFQNSLFVLQQNAVQNEWVNENNFIYYYSTVDPNELGEIQISSIDNLVFVQNSDYVTFNNLKFEYANERGIFSGNSNYMNISNSDFDRCVFAIHDDLIISSYVTIDNNLITNSGSGGVYQYYPVNLTLTNNNITDTGLEIGRMPFIDSAQEYWGYNSIRACLNGGLVEYNNVVNSGYYSFNLCKSQNQALVQYNYAKNPCSVLMDCGAFGVYYDVDPTYSNINKITFKNNIAVYDNYDNLNYTIGYEGVPYPDLTIGFCKDGYFRAANFYDNFAAGYRNAFLSNPSMYSVWERNVGINRVTSNNTQWGRPFTLQDIGSVLWANNSFNNNTFISGNIIYSIVGLVNRAQLNSTSNNSFDYNVLLNPFDTNGSIVYSISGTPSYNNLEDWKAKEAVGAHETSNLFMYNLSGLSNQSNFIWYSVNPTKNNVSVDFPAGYRYYTVEGDIVLNDVLGVYQGKVYYRTIDEGMPQATSVTLSGNSSVGDIQTGSYIYSHEEGNSESGLTYQWYSSYDGTLEARVSISNATNLTYTPNSTYQGQYILFGVEPRSASGTGNLLFGVERFSSLKLIS